MRARLATPVAALIVVVAAGCAPSLPASYHCTVDAQCTLSGQQGRCEPNGACSFADGSCADGQRYGQYAPPGLAGACVGAAGDLGAGGAGGGGGGGGGGGTSAGMITRVGASSLPSSSRMVIALPPPSGLVAGDLVFACVYLASSNIGITAPAGWTLHADLHGALGGEFHAAWYFHVVGASEPPAYGFVLSGASGAAAAAVGYRGVDTTTPIDISDQGQFEGGSPLAPSITTTRANDMLVAMFVQAGSNGITWGAPAGMQVAVDDGAIAIFDGVQTAAGPSGTKQPTPNVPNIGAVDFVALIAK